jgi:hypothetical protein
MNETTKANHNGAQKCPKWRTGVIAPSIPSERVSPLALAQRANYDNKFNLFSFYPQQIEKIAANFLIGPASKRYCSSVHCQKAFSGLFTSIYFLNRLRQLQD